MNAWLQNKSWIAAAFLWGMAEATFFFIVPDVLLSYIGLSRGRHTATTAAVSAALGACVGGAIMYVWSLRDPASAYASVLAAPAVSAAMGEEAWADMTHAGWFAATFLGPLSSTPFKVFAVLAPYAGAPLVSFMIASVIARLPRFLIVALGAAYLRRWLDKRFGLRRLTVVMMGAWIAFYAAFFALMPS